MSVFATTTNVTDSAVGNLSHVEFTPAFYASTYRELRRLAHYQLRRAWSMNTLCTTVLVHEAYLKLFNGSNLRLTDHAHFFNLAARAMRHILVNYAEQKKASKRGSGSPAVSLEDADLHTLPDLESVISVDQALDKVRDLDPSLATLVELRFFAGLTEAEIASLFGQSDRTVRRNWTKAKALMAHALTDIT